MRRLGLILTGGTVGSASAGASEPVVLTSDRAGVPAWARPTLAAAGVPSPLLETPVRRHSEELRPEDWTAIAAACRRLRDRGAQAICVLHGTDTMAFTATALALLLTDLPLPVVLTGSSVPPDAPGSDAAANLRGALVALRELPGGVYVAFAGPSAGETLVHLGPRVRKVQGTGATFASPHAGPVARVAAERLTPARPWPVSGRWGDGGPGGSPPGVAAAVPAAGGLSGGASARPAAAETPPDAAAAGAASPFASGVLGLPVHPGLPFRALDAAVDAGTLRGLVVELYPSGTGPTGDDDRSLERFAARLTARDGVAIGVVAATPGDAGPVYPSLPALRAAGLLVLPGMLLGTATVKLMWALVRADGDPDAVRRLMRRDVAGERPGGDDA